MIDYRFILSNGTQTHVAIPIWKSSLSKVFAYEQEQRFMRATLSDPLVFLKDDYDWIMSQSFETKIYLTIQVDWNGSGTFAEYWKGSFHQTDCTINIDDHSIKVKPNVEDRYNKILAGLKKEYDLMKFTPANQPVSMVRRPMLQIYSAGDSVVSCFCGGMAWEQEANNTDYTDSELVDDLHFGPAGELIQVTFENPPNGLADGFYGTWDHGSAEGEWRDFTSEEGVYDMAYFQETTWASDHIRFTNGLRIYTRGGLTVLWEFSQDALDTGFADIPSPFTMASTRSGVNDLTGSWSGTKIYARWMLGREFANSYKIPASDIVSNNRNYRWCYPYAAVGIIRMTTRHSTTVTEWGIRPDGMYYMQPQLTTSEVQNLMALYPVSRSSWQQASIWILWFFDVESQAEMLQTSMTLRDAYTLEAVISVLLAQIDPTLSFAGTSTYSRFLYGSNPLWSGFGRLVMTPKSNVLVAEYTQPAQKAPVTLAEVFDLLSKALGCWWYIDESKRLRIEHISYFKNGMSYSGTPSVGIDVTQMYESRHGHSWALGTGTYQFDKMEMAERYEYSWMDEVTNPFKGEPIEVRSTFVQEGNIEEVSIAKFNPDVDYMMLNPSDVSEDGFALLCCNVSGGTYSLPFNTVQIGDNVYRLQNWKLAMIQLQPKFLISDMPAWLIRVNGANATALGIQRKKKQQLNVPIGSGDGSLTELVKTTVGDGEIETMTINLSSRKAKIQLRYDTTQQ